MEINEKNISADVYHTIGDIKFIKVGIFGLYLNSITVRPSPKYPEKGLWVKLPSFPDNKGGWIRPIEKNSNGKLWKIIEQKCRDVADDSAKAGSQNDTFEDWHSLALDSAIENL